MCFAARALPCLALLLAGLAPALAAAPESVRPDRVLSVVTADWNGDGSMDRALLVQGEDAADLFIYLSAGPGEDMRLAVYAPGLAWTGILFGTLAELRLTANAASLQVFSQNDAVGRDRWTNTLTLVYRDGVFLVGGYTLETRDTLEPRNATSCDVNLLTGRGIADGKAFRSATRAVPVAQWPPDGKPEGCP